MARELNNSFTRYKLTDEEIIRGQVLTTENAHVIQNLIADAAESKLNLKFDPTNSMAFVQEEAELQGQLGILRLLLDMSLQAQSAIRHNSHSQE